MVETFRFLWLYWFVSLGNKKNVIGLWLISTFQNLGFRLHRISVSWLLLLWWIEWLVAYQLKTVRMCKAVFQYDKKITLLNCLIASSVVFIFLTSMNLGSWWVYIKRQCFYFQKPWNSGVANKWVKVYVFFFFFGYIYMVVLDCCVFSSN